MASTRRLAAILAADVAGYSRLMGADEEGTHERLQVHLRELIHPKIEEHRGRVVKNTGDGFLAEFTSVVDAVRCAVEVQRGMADREPAIPEDRRIRFRIGINLGDVIAAEHDIFGDGVNVAARLEGLSAPGGICVSRVVRDQVRDKLDIAFEDMGDQQVKNIARPVRVFRIPIAEIPERVPAIGASDATPLPLPDKPSIAVLPFQNMSGDPEQEYFADGMVEEIITALSRIRWLFVIARNSTFTYKSQAIDVKQVGRELGVRYVLEGSMRKAGDRVRITTQLIEATSGAHLWADRFDGSLEDVFDLQDKVASSVAGIIEPALHAAETARSAHRPKTDLSAYDAYLRAFAIVTSSAQQIPEALGLLEQAIARDPNYGPALAWAAICCMRLCQDGTSTDREADSRKGATYAHQALRVAGDDPVALSNAAFALAYFGEDLDAMAALADRSLSINPNFARGWFISGYIKFWAGDLDAAIACGENALRLSPGGRVGMGLNLIGAALFLSRRFEQAIPKFLLAIQGTTAPSNYRYLAKGFALDIPQTGAYGTPSLEIILPARIRELAMNAFYEHHKDSIRFGYRCFDRILLNGLIQPFQQPERVVGFFNSYREIYPVSRDVLRGAAEQFQTWVKHQAEAWGAPIVEAPKGRRDEFVEPHFKSAKPDQVVIILKAREPARIMTAIGDRKTNRWHLQIADRWVVQYNLYVNDRQWGRMFLRMCPYLPFSARVYLNQHHWLANRLRGEHIDFEQCSNAFLRCSAPDRLQELADSLTAEDLSYCGRKWLARFTPFFSERERSQGCQHRLFFSQVEFCDNLIFHRRAALDKLGERLLDANRTIGQPNKIAVIFGRKLTRQHRGKLQTEIEDMHLPNPVIRSHYRNGFIKQYVRDHLILRTEAATNNVTDYGVNKAVEHLPALRDKLGAINNNYLDVQQDILETFVDRGQLQQLGRPTHTPSGKRIPGLKLDNPRQLALMHALVRFAQIAAAGTFSTGEIYPHVAAALGCDPQRYSLSSLRYDLSKLHAKGLVEKLPRSRRYRLSATGYSVCLIFLKLFDRLCAPLAAGLLSPVPGDAALPRQKRSLLDRLYERLAAALDRLTQAIGLASPSFTENKIRVGAPITA